MTRSNAPTARYGFTTIWTGTEMIVWGGQTANGFVNTGESYNPVTDSWTVINTANAPSSRSNHSATWTGSEMFVWGGFFYDGSNHYLFTGGSYNPVTDSWTATNTTNAPTGREFHTAIWTGIETIVWGGTDLFGYLNSGGRYNPSANSWTAPTTAATRSGHTAIWTGSAMIVWGGFLNTGGRYCAQPPTPTPTPTPCQNVATVFSENFDGSSPPTLPAGWVATNAINPDATLWVTSNAGVPPPVADSAPNAAFASDPGTVSDKRIDSPLIEIVNPVAQVTFRNNYALEGTFDGGVLEISIGSGAFVDIITAGGSFVTGGYNATISTEFGSPISGRMAWSGSSGGFITTTVKIPVTATGKNIKLRWRMASDTSVSTQGWRIDSVVVTDCLPAINISGTVLYCTNPVSGPVSGATLTLTGTSGGTTLSDASGNYVFSTLEIGGNYTVTASKTARIPGSAGINTTDVIATQRHFLGVTLLTGCRLTAADVNASGGVNTTDVIAIQRFFLGLSTGIANVGKYKLTPAIRSYLKVISDQPSQNYDALVFGDVAAPFVETAPTPAPTASPAPTP